MLKNFQIGTVNSRIIPLPALEWNERRRKKQVEHVIWENPSLIKQADNKERIGDHVVEAQNPRTLLVDRFVTFAHKSSTNDNRIPICTKTSESSGS